MITLPSVEPTEVAEPSEPPGLPVRRTRLGPFALAALMIAALAVAVLVALTQAGRASDLRAERAERREVTRVAAAFGEAYLSYDFQDVAASGDRVLALVTDRFAADFEQTRVPGIEAVFADIETTTTATTTEVFVSDIGDSTARAIVVVDVAAASAAGNQSLRGLSFVAALVRQGDEWRVDAVEPPPSPEVDGATTTTVPATSTTVP